MARATDDVVESLPRWLGTSVAAGLGRAERDDQTLGRSGGPAGNARLTAWTGLLLLVLFAAEGITLIDVSGLISWHVAIGALLIPPVALKVGSTGWRMASYYLGARPYRITGPPPILLRVVGPLVVITSVALLATGVVLFVLGNDTSHQSLASIGPLRVDWIWLHQASFVAWLVVMTVHVLGRLVPAVRTAVPDQAPPGVPPGRWPA